MKTHTLIGAEIIGQQDSPLLSLARLVALCHHEKWNGGGYPNGLAGDGIPLECRIVSIADVYDALTSERPYKRAWSAADALDHVRSEAGKSFDPELVLLFLELHPQVQAISVQYADQQ